MPRISPRSSRSGYDTDESSSGDLEEQDVAIQSGIFKQYLEICDDLEQEEDAERDAVFARGLARVQEYLSAGRVNSMCLICLASIKPSQAVWHCGASCYAVFHMSCIQEWARNQLEASSLRAINQLGSEYSQQALSDARAGASWGCPKCRQLYTRAALPASYTCFCGKETDPEWDPWLAPHTCGQLCEKRLPGHCQHTCRLLCHPGPCPPCPLVVSSKCHCGKLTLKQRCGQAEFSCREVCGRRMSCGHSCPEVCHPGECAPCQKPGVCKCRCGSESRKLACSARDFQCAKVCGKPLRCGRHTCQQLCHSGPCGGCPFEGSRSCPCGKTSYPGLKCDETAQPCGETCGKLLACGMHTCVERCHYGECSKVCRDTVTKTCRCGKTQKTVLCHQEVLCEKRCTALRNCGRHPCKRKCCDGNCPPCEEVCNRWLRCGNHKCPAPCHTGPCRPCPLTFTVSCACGHTKHTLPCGSEAKAAPPRCPRTCPVPAICRHAADRKPHHCHYGPCPPCRAACGSNLPCGHTCGSSSCHDPAAPAVADWQRPKPTKSSAQQAAAAAGGGSGGKGGSAAANGRSSPVDVPAAMAAATAARELLGLPPTAPSDPKASAAAAVDGTTTSNSSSTSKVITGSTSNSSSSSTTCIAGGGLRTPCPPCVVPVVVGCVGHHVQQAFPCCELKPFSCGQACGQPLACGNHTCSKPCHAVPASIAAIGGGDGTTSSSSRAEAGQVLANGAHPAAAATAAEACEVCTRPCLRPRSCDHPCPSSCHPGPCEACQVPRSCSCHCGKTTLQFPCCKYQAIEQQQQQLLRQHQQQQAKAGKAKGAAGNQKGLQQRYEEEQDLLCCGKPCYRELEFCRHPCRAACHLAACPSPEQCQEELTVRCDCRRLKQKWPCWKVQQALVAAGRSRVYDGAVAPRLLPCDAACGASAGGGGGKERRSVSLTDGGQPAGAEGAGGTAAASKGIAGGSAVTAAAATMAAKLGLKRVTGAKGEAAAPPSAGEVAAGDAASAAGGKAGTKKLSRAEREALAAEKEAERRRQEQREKLKLMLLYLLVILLVGGLGGGLGLTVYKLLRTVDQKAQAVWRPDEI